MALRRLNDLDIDLDRRLVRRDGAVLAVTGLNFDVPASLIAAAPSALGADELGRAAWGLDHVSDETVARRIGLLREALGDDARRPRYVRTVRGRGYALAVPIAAPPRPAAPAAPVSRRRMIAAAPVLAGLCALFTLAAWPAQTEYALTLVDGANGAVNRSTVTAASGAAPVELVDAEDGSVMLRTARSENADRAQAATLVRLAAGHIADPTGDRVLARRYLAAALSLDPENAPARKALEVLGAAG